MDRDDNPVGRLLTRREIVKLLGVSSAALAGSAMFLGSRLRPNSGLIPSCVARPQQTEGPYFVDEDLHRSDIRSDPASGIVSPGTPFTLTFVVSQITESDCVPLQDAQIDVWHCDATGVYSDVHDPRFNTVGQKFLRGYQITDRTGQAVFRTIYPGWYPGRAVHVHFKVRTPSGPDGVAEFTSQLYFDDALNDRVHALEPYSSKGGRTPRNSNDPIFRRGGERLLLSPEPAGDGYRANFSLGLQLT